MITQPQDMHWRSFETYVRRLLQQIAARQLGPTVEASGDECLLLRLFRTLPEEVQDDFLEEIGKKALLSVCPDIEEDDDDVGKHLGNEIRQLMPHPPDYDSFKQAFEKLAVASIIFGSSRYHGDCEADVAASAMEDRATRCDFSSEELDGYIAEWREKVVAEIEWRVASNELDSASLDYMARERNESDPVADLLAQALAVVGGKIEVEFSCDRLKCKTICRDTMSLVEMANDLHVLLQFLWNKGNIHWSCANVSRIEILDLSRDMKKDPDQSLLKQVEYQKKMIQLLESMLADFTNYLNQQNLREVVETLRKIFRDQGNLALAGQYSSPTELLALDLNWMDDPALRAAILRMFQNHPNQEFSEATKGEMLRIIQDSSRSKEKKDQALIHQLLSLMHMNTLPKSPLEMAAEALNEAWVDMMSSNMSPIAIHLRMGTLLEREMQVWRLADAQVKGGLESWEERMEKTLMEIPTWERQKEALLDNIFQMFEKQEPVYHSLD